MSKFDSVRSQYPQRPRFESEFWNTLLVVFGAGSGSIHIDGHRLGYQGEQVGIYNERVFGAMAWFIFVAHPLRRLPLIGRFFHLSPQFMCYFHDRFYRLSYLPDDDTWHVVSRYEDKPNYEIDFGCAAQRMADLFGWYRKWWLGSWFGVRREVKYIRYGQNMQEGET